MALYLREGSEESNIRGLVESCAHNDDITPLIKLVFEAQALAETHPSIVADGQAMVNIITGALRSVGDDQAAVVEEVCHSNATAIAQTVAELEQMHRRVEEVKITLLEANAGMQAAGNALVGNVQHVSQLEEVQTNLQQAAAAVQAAQAVLEQCLIAGELIKQQQLYPALCMLDKIRRKHLGSLLSMLSGSKPGPGKASSSSSTAAAGLAPGSSSSRHMTGRDLEHLQQLQVFFHSLVDDMSTNVQRLALRGFNAWLVSMRACARQVGMSAIQSASVERSLEEHLAGERKALLSILHRPGPKTVRDIAAELGTSGFRQELLQAAADEAASQAAKKAASSAIASSTSAAAGDRSTGSLRDASDSGDPPAGSGVSFSAASASLRDLLKRPSQTDKLPRQLAAAAEAAAAEAAAAEAAAAEAAAAAQQQQQREAQQHRRQQDWQQQQQQQQLPEEPGADDLDLEELYPGEPEKAVRELIDRGDRRNTERARRERRLRRQQQQVQQQQQQQQQQDQEQAVRLSADPSGGLKGLMQLDMKGLYTAVHVAKCLAQLDNFRQHYVEQRRLQITADLQPPPSFLQSYQAYLAQVTGFFVLESFVSRVTEGLLGPLEAAQLWGVALRALKGVLEPAFELQLSTAPQMLMVKEFVVLMCVALERAGHQVMPVTEMLQATCGRYHDLLGATLGSRMAAVVEADVLGELEVRTAAQHSQLVNDYNLPWQLEGAGLDGRRVQLGPNGVPALPYVAPFTSCVPELLDLIRNFILDSLTYLRDLYSPWELLPAVFHQRDRMLSKVLVEVLSSKARAVGSAELLRESMKCAANAWALAVALNGLDDWTLAQIRPDVAQELPQRKSGGGATPPGRMQQAAAGTAQAAGAASKLTRVRHRKAVLASGALTNTVQAALKALQDSSERDVLRGLTTRVEQLLEASRKADWAPGEPLPSSQSAWVNALLSYLQEIFDTGIKLLPRSSVVNIMRLALRSIATACMRTFSPDGVKVFNMYAVEKLAHNLLTIERFAGRWGVSTLDQELAEPTQLCKLLLSGRPDAYVTSQETRQHYPALSPAVLLHALERYKEVPGQAKKKPDWATKKTTDAAVKQLKAQAAAAAAVGTASPSRMYDAGEASPGKLPQP